jgi:PHD/YefM family antitoxin component YafN of YafNO toxin-antitoxin module
MGQENVLTSAELKRRGIAAIEQALLYGPVHLIKRNQAAAVVLSEQHYSQLQLLSLSPAESSHSKDAIDTELAAERDW